MTSPADEERSPYAPPTALGRPGPSRGGALIWFLVFAGAGLFVGTAGFLALAWFVLNWMIRTGGGG